MRMTRDQITIADFLDLHRNGMLKVNPEYQRGQVWSANQKKKLIDSVMRGYPLPLIYLHYIEKTVAGMTRQDLEIIDGQQRILALHEFAEGAFKLLDPKMDHKTDGRFPNFLKGRACPWANQDYASLSEELRAAFDGTALSIVRIETNDENEVRDLFIRLQAGLALNRQETRDAWPGNFTDVVLRLGGKPQITRYPGHGFFKNVLRMKAGSDRGRTRQLAAQIAMLFLVRRREGADHFVDINAAALDDFYYSHIDLDAKGADIVRLSRILDKLEQLFRDGKRPRMRGHEAIHLVLFTDTLWDDYTRGWEADLARVHDEFVHQLNQAKATKDNVSPDEFWTQYGQWTRVNSDRGERILRRHQFYTREMFRRLSAVRLKDPKRSFGPIEREIIYFRDGKSCQVCLAPVTWSEAEIHHVDGHAQGGGTSLENGVLVHAHCHPKGEAAERYARERPGSSTDGPQPQDAE